MKKWTSKLVAASLAVVMVASSITPTALAAANGESKKAVSDEKFVLEDNTKDLLEAAKVMASYSELVDSLKDEKVSPEKEAVKDVIFHSYNEEADLSGYDITSKEMDKLTKEVLEENSMEDAVDVTYETDAKDQVTTVSVEMDSVVAMAAEEVAATGLTQEQKDDIVSRYAAYQKSMVSVYNPETEKEENIQDLFGVQTPYFTNKDTDACPIGSLLSIAGIPNYVLEYGLDVIVAQGIMDYDTIVGIIDLFTYANQFAVMMKAKEMGTVIKTALSGIPSGADTTEEILLYINDWLAQNCTFDMPYIMEMTSPETDTTSEIAQDRQEIYEYMYNNIYEMVYDQVYEQVYAQVYDEVYNQVYKQVYNLTLVNTGNEEEAAAYAESEAKTQAEAYAPSEAETYAKGYAAQYMDASTEDGSANGSESAMTLAASIINLWEGNHVGALTYGTAVCLGYSNAYTLLVQHAFPDVYREDGKSDGAWKSYEELNEGSNGSWDAMVDYVRISFDTEVTMFGVTQDDFTSDHYWNAVKVKGDWYYVDPCYTDVFVEVMARDRVETNGNMAHLYFMFSHEAAEELYDGYYSNLDTAYADAANDRTYEDAWLAFARSPIFAGDGYYYYTYDSTDMIEQQQDSSSSSYENDTEYKVVRRSMDAATYGTDYDTLVDFTAADGEDSTYAQIYNPKTEAMEKDALVQEMYEKHTSYQEDYPSLQISVAYYNGLVYFNLANCIFTYDVETGAVERVYEYNEVYGERDMQVAFGGMAFATTDKNHADVSVLNPPIAGMTVKGGTMYVDIATTLGFISGKDRDNMDDPSNYGYEFEETNYNQEYLYASYMDGDNSQYEQYIDTKNDNDEFMWSANIVETVDLGCNHSYEDVTIAETCTTAEFTESRCSSCGKVASDGLQKTTVTFEIVDEKGEAVELKDAEGNAIAVEDLVTETLERNFILDAFSYENVKAHVDAAFGDVEYLAIDLPETIEWSKPATAKIVVAGDDSDVIVGDELEAIGDAKLTVKFVKEGHKHVETCYEEKLTCEVEQHDHSTDCYTRGELICKDEEHIANDSHTNGCYQVVLNCTDKHHTDECYTDELVCDEKTEDETTEVTITRKAVESYTFTADEIKAYVPSGYVVTGTVSESTVNVKEVTEKEVVVEKVAADTASLQVIVKTGEVEVGSTIISKVNDASDATEATFTADEISTAAAKLYNSDIYKATTVESNAVKLGEKEVLTIALTPAEYEATLTINVSGSEEPITLTSTTKGVKGEYFVFTAEAIETALGLEEGYAVTSIISDRVVEFSATGEIGVTVESTTEAVEGHGHEYVEHRETYYTRENEDDESSAFNKGTCYVCIHCKDAVEDKPTDQMYTLSNSNLTDVWTWSVDLESASLYEIPTELKNVLLDCVWENPEVGSKRTVAEVSDPEQSGTCDQGLSYKYTATANGKTTSKTNTLPAGNHVYSDASINYRWDYICGKKEEGHVHELECLKFICETKEHTHGEACYELTCTSTEEDHVHVAACYELTCKTEEHEHGAACYSAPCRADYECEICNTKGSDNCAVEARDIVASCDSDAYAVYTAVIELAGVPYSNQNKIATGDLAYGHDYDDEYKICRNCGKDKPASVIALPESLTVSYTGEAITDMTDYVQVEGSTGKVSFGYYVDKNCKTKTSKSEHGASKAGRAPSKIGVYYVRASVAEDDNYLKDVSNVCKLVIAPKQVSGVKVSNESSGLKLTWKKSSEATGYVIYKRVQDGAYKRVKVVKNNSTLTWTDTDVTASNVYAYDVRAYKKSATSSSNVYSISNVDGTDIVRAKVATANHVDGLKLKWSRMPGATSYRVYRKASGESKYTKIATVDSNSVVYYDSSVKSGNTYSYYVKATGKHTERTVIASRYYLADPAIKKLTSNSSKVRVTWTKNTKATGYQVQYATSSSFDENKKTIKITSKNTVERLISGLKGKTEYFVRVRAYKTSGSTTYYSAWTTTESISTK